MPVLTATASPAIAARHGLPLPPGRLPLAGPHEQWYVLRAIPTRERKIALALQALTLSYFSPHRPRAVRSARTILEGQEPLFPGFLFLLATESDLTYRALRSHAVTRHLVASGTRATSTFEVGNPDLPRRRQAAQRHFTQELQAIAQALRADQRTASQHAHYERISGPRPLTQQERNVLARNELILAGAPLEVTPQPPRTSTGAGPLTTESKLTLTIHILGQAVDLITTPRRLLKENR
jgi:hypothetical protein